MKLERFKERDNKKIGIIVFTVSCILLVAGAFFFRSFALFEEKKNFNVINGVVTEPGDLYFAYYVDGAITFDIPTKDSGYTLASKSTCNNGVTVSWDDETWSALIDYQNYEKGNSSKTKCNLYFEEVLSPIRVISSNDKNGLWEYKFDITKLVIQDQLAEIPNSIKTTDESESQDKSIMSYVVPNEDNTTYTAYLQSNKKLYLNSNSANLFKNFESLQTIEGMEYLDASKVTNMTFMFSNCISITSLDVSNFNAINVTYMAGMFGRCSSLISLDLSNFNTENVTSMSYMFSDCSSLNAITYGDNFIHKMDADISDMYKNCLANKPTHESWNGVTF